MSVRRTATWMVGSVVVCCLSAGCGDEETEKDAIPFDSSTHNFIIDGTFQGIALGLNDVEVAGLEGEREYRGPYLAGTDPGEAIPDIPQTQLCEVEVHNVSTIDGTEWEIEIEFENFVSESFGIGKYTIIDPATSAASEQTSIEFQMESGDTELEATAVSGWVDIKVYTHDSTHAENTSVLMGGSLGGTYHLEFGPDEVLEGSFHVDFADEDIKGEEC